MRRSYNLELDKWLPYALEIFEPREQRDQRQMLERLSTLEKISPFMVNQPIENQKKVFDVLATPDAGQVRGLWNKVWGREQNRPPLFTPGESISTGSIPGDTEGYAGPIETKTPVYFQQDFSKYFKPQGAVDAYGKRVRGMGLPQDQATRLTNEFGAGRELEKGSEELRAEAVNKGLTDPEDIQDYITSGGKGDRTALTEADKKVWAEIMAYKKANPNMPWSDIIANAMSGGASKRVLNMIQTVSGQKNYESLAGYRQTTAGLAERKFDLATARDRWQEGVARARLMKQEARNQTEVFKAYSYLRGVYNDYVKNNNDNYKWQVQNGQTPEGTLMNGIPDDFDSLQEFGRRMLGEAMERTPSPPPPPSMGGAATTPPASTQGRSTPAPQQKKGFDLKIAPDKVYNKYKDKFVD